MSSTGKAGPIQASGSHNDMARCHAGREKRIFPGRNCQWLIQLPAEAAFSMPCIIGRNGLEKQIPLPLDDEEYEKLQLSIKDIQFTLQSVKWKSATASWPIGRMRLRFFIPVPDRYPYWGCRVLRSA